MFRQPYWGEPSKKPPKSRKPKRDLTPKEKLRSNIISILVIFVVVAIFSLLGVLVSRLPWNQAWLIALFVPGIFLLIFGLDAWITRINNYLKADDLDEPEYPDKEQENNGIMKQ